MATKKELYQQLLDKAKAGEQVNLDTLAFGFFDPNGHLDWNEVSQALKDAGRGDLVSALDQRRQLWLDADPAALSRQSEALKNLGTGDLSYDPKDDRPTWAKGAAAVGATVAGSAALVGGVPALGRLGALGTLALRSVLRHPIKALTGLTAGAVAINTLTGGGESAGPTGTNNQDPSATQTTAPQSILVPDAQGNYQNVPITALGPEFGSSGVLNSTAIPTLSPDLAALQNQYGVQASLGSNGQTLKDIFDPNALGYVTTKDPIELIGQPYKNVPNAGAYQGPDYATQDRYDALHGGTPSGRTRSQPDASMIFQGQIPAQAQAEFEKSQTTIPAGAQINSAVGGMYQDRTLLEWASTIAHRWGVPLNLLYGMVNLESGWNPSAVGDNGNSHGLVQIYQVAHPDISIAQANDPVFALNYAAKNMKQWYDKYGRWDVAVAQHNSPVAAEHLAQTGEFYNSKSQSYVSQIFKYANASGLSNWQFDASGNSVTADAGAGKPGFASPDPATLRQFVRSTYSDVLGRDPTPEELDKGVAKMNSLYRVQWDRSMAQSEGSDVQSVDPAAQFTENLQQSGEGQFNRYRGDQRDFMSYAGNIARLLQGGL